MCICLYAIFMTVCIFIVSVAFFRDGGELETKRHQAENIHFSSNFDLFLPYRYSDCIGNDIHLMNMMSYDYINLIINGCSDTKLCVFSFYFVDKSYLSNNKLLG